MGIQFDGINNKISSQTKIDFPGSIGIAGTLTYEDVTNVDSVGVITARQGIRIGAGKSIGSDGAAVVYYGDGSNLTGAGPTFTNGADNRVITASSASAIQGEANLTYNGSILHNQISAGARNDFSTSADGLIIEKGGNTGLSIDPGSSGTANIYFPNESNHSIAAISHNNSNGELRFRGEDHIILSTNNNTERLRINSSGQIMIGDSTVGNSTTEKLILQGQIGNNDYESSIALRRGTTIGSNDAGLGYIKFQDSAGSTGAQIGGRADSGWSGSTRPTHLLFQTVKSGSTSLTEACRITSDGYLQQHKLIAVSYSDSRQISLTNVDLTPSNFYNATFYESDSSILDSNGHFVAPVHGIYRLYFRCTTDSTSGNRANVRLRKNGTTINEAYDSYGTSGHYNSVSSEIILPLNAGEYMDIQVAQLHTQGGTQHKVVNFHMLG